LAFGPKSGFKNKCRAKINVFFNDILKNVLSSKINVFFNDILKNVLSSKINVFFNDILKNVLYIEKRIMSRHPWILQMAS